MRPSITRILFAEHKVVSDNSYVSGIEIDFFLKAARNSGIELKRITDISEIFERAILHLDEAELEILLKKLKTPLIALLSMTTKRPGIPPAKFHIKEDGPSRIIFAVRRMEALKEPEVWTSFLRASEEDCIAVYEGRISDLRDEARPMLRLLLSEKRLFLL